MMQRIILIMFFILFISVNVFAAETPLPPLKGADMWFTQPKAGEKTHDSYWKVMLYRANKVHPSDRWRYYPHISNREYLDCTYYKYVNCEDIRFCRCWQCKDYQYKWEYSN